MSAQDTATRLIAKHGRSCTLRKTAGDYASGRPWSVDVGTPTDSAVTAVFLDYSEREIEGIVSRGDQKVLISGVSAVSDQHRLLDGTAEWRIMNITKTSPGDTVFLYELQVRR